VPAILVSRVKYGIKGYKEWLISVQNLTKYFPYKDYTDVKAYSLELYNEDLKLVHRFKPPCILSLFLVTRDNTQYLKLPDDFVRKYGIANDYYLVLLITMIGNHIVFPHEVKVIEEVYTHDIVKRLEECYGTLGFSLFKMFHLIDENKPELAKAMQYLVDSYHRYVDGDLEGSIPQLRNAVQVLRDEVLSKVQELEGYKSLKRYSENLVKHLNGMLEHVHEMIKTLYNILSIGGPHPRPPPRECALLAFKVTLSLIEYLAKVA